MRPPRLEKQLGIEVYATRSPGIGGQIRLFNEDFMVREILVDGSRAEFQKVIFQSPTKRGRYLICVLTKNNWDTFLAVKAVATRLDIDPKRIHFGGIKDTKALTTQHISISRITPKQVSRVKIGGILLFPLRFSNRKVSSNDILRNQFLVSIRSVSLNSPEIKRRFEHIKDELYNLGGFPNFFGHQRFGTIRPITHIVGRFLVRGDLENAAFIFLTKTSSHEHPESKEARQRLLETQNFVEALSSFPKGLRYERWMLHHLAKHRKDHSGAFRKLPLKLLKLFVQAYQSFLFNRFLSKRIQQGIPLDEARIGDYVLSSDIYGLPTKKIEKVTAKSIQRINNALKNGKMHNALPLIGYKQPLSDGVQGDIERGILKDENTSPKDFCVSLMPEIGSSGSLRTSLTPLLDLSVEEITKDPANPNKLKLELSFKLRRGSYATTFLRELMKPKNVIKAGF